MPLFGDLPRGRRRHHRLRLRAVGTAAPGGPGGPGRTTTLGGLHGTLILVPGGGPPRAWGEILYGTCAVSIAVTEESPPEIRGDCDFHHQRHRLYAVAERALGDAQVGGGGEGLWGFIGGTGKFKTLVGECPYTIEYFEDDELVAAGRCRIAENRP